MSPCMASAFGRCLALAVNGAVPATLDCTAVPVPDPALVQVNCHPKAQHANFRLCFHAVETRFARHLSLYRVASCTPCATLCYTGSPISMRLCMLLGMIEVTMWCPVSNARSYTPCCMWLLYLIVAFALNGHMLHCMIKL